MNRKIGLGLLSLFFSSLTFAVTTPINGTYVGMTFGTSYVPSIDGLNVPISTTILANSTITAIQPNIGGNLGLTIGRRFKDRYRIEAELIGAYAQLKETTLTNKASGYSTKGYLSTYSALYLNAFVDLFSSHGDFHQASPYFGVGIGKAYTVLKDELYLNDVFVSNLVKNKESTSVMQAIFGISYFLDDYTSMGIDLQFQKYSNLKSINNGYSQVNLNITMKTTLGD